MKRLSRLLQVGLAAFVAGVLIWGVTAEIGDVNAKGFRFIRAEGLGYTPDSTGVDKSVNINPWLAPGQIDTSSNIIVSECDCFALSIQGDADSIAYWVDYSINGVWTNLTDSSFVDPTSGSTTQIKWDQYEHMGDAIAGGTRSILFDGFLYQQLRVRLQNVDTGVASADTFKNIAVDIACGY